MGIEMYRLPNKYSYIKPAAALTQSSWGKRDKVRPCVVNKPACHSLVGMQLFLIVRKDFDFYRENKVQSADRQMALALKRCTPLGSSRAGMAGRLR